MLYKHFSDQLIKSFNCYFDGIKGSVKLMVLSVPGHCDSKSGQGEKIFFFVFGSRNLKIAVNLELIHYHAKWSFHELIHHVWRSIRLNNLIAGHTKLIKKDYNNITWQRQNS